MGKKVETETPYYGNASDTHLQLQLKQYSKLLIQPNNLVSKPENLYINRISFLSELVHNNGNSERNIC